MTLEWHGVPDMSAVLKRAHQAGAGALLGAANKTVPLESADLKNSGMAVADDKQGAVSYDEPYAIVQHETLYLQHTGQGQAKWLEKATRSEQAKIMEAMAVAVRRELS
jgi:hypothetical protein